MSVDTAIRMFANFLNDSWATASKLLPGRKYTSDEDSYNDWLQANWELLVERKILRIEEYLEVYGDGADYNASSSRITDPEAISTFKVIVKSKNNEKIFDLLNCENVVLEYSDFEKIVGFRNGFYTLEPEFRYVLIRDINLGLERVLAIDDIQFELEKIVGRENF